MRYTAAVYQLLQWSSVSLFVAINHHTPRSVLQIQTLPKSQIEHER